jgi:hypothetical protein
MTAPMTDTITIPPEALEAASRAFAANERNWQMYAKRMEAACLAMLRAWPGMEHLSATSIRIGGADVALPARINLPLPPGAE